MGKVLSTAGGPQQKQPLVLPGLAHGTLKGWVGGLAVSALALPLFCGCGSKKADAQAQTAEVEKVFPDLAAVAPAQPGASVPIGDPRIYVSAALSAVRSNDLATGIIMLKKAMRLPGLTVAQVTALQTARHAWITDLATRADRGEENAKAALAAIDRAE